MASNIDLIELDLASRPTIVWATAEWWQDLFYTGLIIIGLIAISGLILYLFFLVVRKVARSRAGPLHGLHLYRLTLPRFKFDTEGKQGEAIAQIREKIALAETLFSAIGGLKPSSWRQRFWLGSIDRFSFEIIGKDKLVSFYVGLPAKHREFIQQQIHAQWTEAQFEEISGLNPFHPFGTTVGAYLTLERQSFLPLKTYKEQESDPLNTLTNVLGKIAEGDSLSFQVIVQPAGRSWRKTALSVVKKMQKGEDFKSATHGSLIGSWFATDKSREKEKEKLREKKLSTGETRMLEGIENKLTKAGLETTIRLIASASTPPLAHGYLSTMLQAFAQYSIYEFGNNFTKSLPKKSKLIGRAWWERECSDRHHSILNTEELASIWHLPSSFSETPNILWMESRSAPAPIDTPTHGLHLGYNLYRGQKTDVFIKDQDRRRHMYIIGKTGSGKTEFMKSLVLQDVRAGAGVAVIDPHGDLVEDILGLIPPERTDDVIYFNPADTDRPMGLNMLEAPSENFRDFAVQEMISIFYMLFPPEMIGPMFEHSMRNYMLTLMADLSKPGTLVEIPRMISDEAFQKEWVSRVKDPVVKSFWEDEMAKTSDYHKSEMMGYLVSKVGRFVENEMMRNIIGQTKSAFNFRDIMNNKKILLVNLSKGKVGDVNASLLGLILVAKIQMAAFSRADIAEEDREDFYLYIDEFQNFVTPSIATILSEARKYRLNLVMAHQYMGQLVKDGKSEIRDAVLGNVGSMFSARLGPDDVEVLGKVFEPVFTAQDLMNSDRFTWNVKLIIDNAQAKPFTLKTFPPEKTDSKRAQAIKELSRLKFGVDKLIVEQEIMDRSGLNKKTPQTTKDPALPINR